MLGGVSVVFNSLDDVLELWAPIIKAANIRGE
jgi:hypothetical protein